MTDLEQFTAAYIEALYFTDAGDGDQPGKDAALDPETLLDIQADCRSFWRRFGCFVNAAECTRGSGEYSIAAQAGHDFWLTRNGHGAGFWDGDWNKPYANMLAEGAQCYGVFETYLSDAGTIAA